MKRRRFIQGVVVALVLGIATSATAQTTTEPVYLVTLPDKQVVTLTTVLTPSPDGTKTARLVTLPDGYGRSDFLLSARVTVKPSGYASAAQAQLGIKLLPKLVLLQARRVDEEADGKDSKSTWEINVPTQSETIPFSGATTTLLTAQALIGRQYDFKRGGEQKLSCLLDIVTPQPQVYSLTLKSNGTEAIPLSDGKIVKTHRLVYQTDLPYLPQEQKTGTLYIGPRGEIVRCDTNLFALPFKLKTPMRLGKDGSTWEARYDRKEAVFLREYAPTKGEHTIGLFVGEKGEIPISTVTTSPDGTPLTLESPWLGRKLSVRFTPRAIDWKLDSTPPATVAVAEGNAWFLPFWFVTETWETGAGPWANMAIGDKRTGTYLPLFTGQSAGEPFAIERQPDYRNVVNGQEMMLHRFRVQTKVVFDVLTDGKRLVYYAGSDGAKVTRNGFESLGNSIPAPKPPPAP